MQAPAETSKATKSQPRTSSDARSSSSLKRFWLCPIFALALAVRLWFAFADGHGAITFSCDASEYLRDARGLSQLIDAQDSAKNFAQSFRLLSDNLTGQEATQLRQHYAPVKELAIAGPIFPLFLLLSFATFGLPVAQINWQAPVIFQCLLTAVTCVLIAYIGKAAWGRKVGIAAGAIAALYPGFIVNSIRMYSESFSCFLLCAVVALAIPVVGRSGMFHSVTAGICLAFLQLTRSVMVLVTALTFVLTAWLSPGRSRLLRLAGLVAGLALVFAPWLLFQQLAFGKSSVVVDRVGHYNLFIGTNVSTQGYLSYPYPDGKGIEKKNYGTLVAAQIKESPERFARLMLDKPLRLFKFPWNDFRTPIGTVGIGAQVIFHQIVLAFASIGAALCLFQKTNNDARIRLRLLLATLWGMHLVYLIFITVPRYNLTSMPFLILFAAAGLVSVLGALRNKRPVLDKPPELSQPTSLLSRPAAGILLASLALAMIFARTDWFGSILVPLGASPMVALVVSSATRALPLVTFFVVLYIAAGQLPKRLRLVKLIPAAMALIVIPLCALPLRSNGRLNEWTLPSDSAQAAKQFISIPANKRDALVGRDCFILVDCMNWQALGNDGHVLVNGVEVNGPVLPIMPFAQDFSQIKSRARKASSEQHYLECEDIYSSLTAAAGGGNLDLRQWFAIPVPRAVLDAAASQEEPGLNIEIDQKQSTGSDIYGVFADANEKHVRIPSVSRFSWEKAFYGVEAEDGFTDSRYDDRISVDNTEQLRSAGDTTNWIKTANIRLLVAPPTGAGAHGTDGIIASTQANRSAPAKLALNETQLPTYNKDGVWLVSIAGKLSSLEKQAKNIPLSFSATFESLDEQGVKHRYRSPWVPTSVVSSPGSNNFRFAFPFQPGALPGRLSSVSIECLPGGVAAGTDYFSVNGSRSAELKGGKIGDNQNIDSLSLELFNLPSNPIGYGYEVL